MEATIMRRADGIGTRLTKHTKTTQNFVILAICVAFVSASAAKPLRRDLAVARADFCAGTGGPQPWAVTAS